jgi:hypothetical protein
VVPTHESLDADGALVREPEHRLVVDNELALAQGAGELRDEGRPMCGGRAHLELEQRAPATAGPLRGVHRQVGVVQEREEVLPGRAKATPALAEAPTRRSPTTNGS